MENQKLQAIKENYPDIHFYLDSFLQVPAGYRIVGFDYSDQEYFYFFDENFKLFKQDLTDEELFRGSLESTFNY